MVVQKIIQIIDLLSLSWAIQTQLKNRKIESGLLKVLPWFDLKSTMLCHFGLLTALMKLITTISSSPSSCCSSTPPPRRPQYPEMYTGSNEVWGDVTMLTITDFSLDNIMLLVFATLISPSPSIRCSFIYHSLDAAIVFSRIVDSVYLVWIHNGWWFSYPVIWFGPSEGRNDEASWLWPSSRPNQIYLILMTYCTWQFLVSLERK